MVAVVTGAAGFIGSTLCRDLLEDGQTVRGIDCLTKNYALDRKVANLSPLLDHSRFELLYADLTTSDLEPVLHDADVVYHIAGQPSVGASWGVSFLDYSRNNVEATRRLLDACCGRSVRKVVNASSSSLYGDAEVRPTPETALPRPVSPYGVTKLAAEHLCYVYQRNFGLPTASLRLFTVYGPAQRPDMAFSRIVDSAVNGTPFLMNGDGLQTRDFTYVADVVAAFRQAAASDWTGVANVGGGSAVTLREAIGIVEDLCGPVNLVLGPPQAGDARHTSADISVAREGFGYAPSTSIAEGLAAMVASVRTADREAEVA